VLVQNKDPKFRINSRNPSKPGRYATLRMSPIRILFGLLIAAIFFVDELVAIWLFNFSATWIPITLFLFVSLGGG
jgi:hypothetical protein